MLKKKLGMAMHASHPSTWEVGGRGRDQEFKPLCSKFKVSQDYMKPTVKTTSITEQELRKGRMCCGDTDLKWANKCLAGRLKMEGCQERDTRVSPPAPGIL